MQENKIDIENAKVSLEGICATLSLEDMDDQNTKCKGHESVLLSRLEALYLPALEMVLCSASDLAGRM